VSEVHKNAKNIRFFKVFVAVDKSDAEKVIDLIDKNLYVGEFTTAAREALDCFDFSLNKKRKFPNVQNIPIFKIAASTSPWTTIDNIFYGHQEAKTIKIDDKNEGEMLERTVWASLESVFPNSLYKSPTVKVGDKLRELTDVFSFYKYGSFLIEAKDLSIFNANERSQEKRTNSVQKQVKKAIAQLVGASTKLAKGNLIFINDGKTEICVERDKPPHSIIIITELMHFGDWSEIEKLLTQSINETKAFFNLMDLREFISLLKSSPGKPELIDYNLMERCKFFLKHKSVFIRSQP
jgi:hypothetical protein